MPRRILLTILLLTGLPGPIPGQPTTRRATNVAALRTFAAYFHGRPVLILAKVVAHPSGLEIEDPAGTLHLIARGAAPEGIDEIRGDFWDIGRMKSDDPRLLSPELRARFHLDSAEGWPKPGEVLVLVADSMTAASPPAAPSIRSIVLEGERYLNQTVTVSGQFRGRNLFADLPDAPARSRWDFVIGSGDAAIWVSGAPPKGRGFDLSLDARTDTARWLEVTGTVREGRGLQWIEVRPEGIALGHAPTEAPADDSLVVRLPVPPPEVVFSAPIADESDVPPTADVRLQFSRDIDPSSLKGHIEVAYLAEASGGAPGTGTVTPVTAFTSRVIGDGRVVDIHFTAPLEPGRRIRVALLDGLRGSDKQPVKPWSLTFRLGF